jgi:NodT family efflux transporter outer membrane factor (OMF) lipoprotein
MRQLLLAGVASVLVTGCAVTPSPLPESAIPEVPSGWRETAQGEVPVSAAWWQAYGDPHLTTAVEAALAGNVDIAVAEARVREAEALAVQARAALLPSLDLAVGGQLARSLSAFGTPSEAGSGSAQLQAAYEVDLWGRVRNSDAAARASLQASRYGRDTVNLSVAAATARAYIALLSLDAQLEIARRTLASRDEALRLAARRAEVGTTSRLELTQATAEQRAAARQLPALELAVTRQENALRLLTGASPGPVARGRLEALTLTHPQADMPSSLMGRRPDIAQAEAQLIAADASLASAKASLLPQVRLTASLGELAAEGIDPLTIWSVGGSVLAPLFNHGRLAAGVDASEARRDQAAFAYRKAVLTAFGEVENALAGIDRLQRQAIEAEAQHQALIEGLRHARNRYRAGYASYLEELDAQRGLLNVELGLVQLQETRLLNSVALYQALGGGWR